MDFAARAVADYLHLETLPFHAHEIVLACGIYTSIYYIGSPAHSGLLVPETYSRLAPVTRLNWDVRVTSFINSTFISAFAIYVIAQHGDGANSSWEDRLWGYTRLGGTVQACAAGYFLWDVAISALYIDILGEGSLVHAIFALLITTMGFKPFANYYGLRFILYELSTPFLNIHWFLDKLNMTGSRLQLWNGICLIFVFFACRLVWGSYQSFCLYSDAWAAWTTNLSENCQQIESLQNPKCAPAVPIWLLLFYVGSNSILSVLNFYWFGKMITAVRKRFENPDKKKSLKAGHT